VAITSCFKRLPSNDTAIDTDCLVHCKIGFGCPETRPGWKNGREVLRMVLILYIFKLMQVDSYLIQ
jgi:hypothetical protein